MAFARRISASMLLTLVGGSDAHDASGERGPVGIRRQWLSAVGIVSHARQRNEREREGPLPESRGEMQSTLLRRDKHPGGLECRHGTFTAQ